MDFEPTWDDQVTAVEMARKGGVDLIVMPERQDGAGDDASLSGSSSLVARMATRAQVVRTRGASNHVSMQLRGVARVRIAETWGDRPPFVVGVTDVAEDAVWPSADLARSTLAALRQAERGPTRFARVQSPDWLYALPVERLAYALAGRLAMTSEEVHEVYETAGHEGVLATLRRILRRRTPGKPSETRESGTAVQSRPRVHVADEPEEGEVALTTRIRALPIPENVRGQVEKQLRDAGWGEDGERARQLLAEFPWAEPQMAPFAADTALATLDARIGGMSVAKQAVIDQLTLAAWRRQHHLPPEGTGILMVGPPGTGKTAFAAALAEATGRSFVRIPMAGAADDIHLIGCARSWRRAQAGEIIRSLCLAGTRHTLMLFDEIDKLDTRNRATTALATLLSLLDGEQNTAFRDIFLEVPVDLSPVLFVLAANDIDAVHPALIDRCTVVMLDGYESDDKARLTATHLLPALLRRHAVGENQLRLTQDAVDHLVERTGEEPGLRGLRRDLNTVLARSLPGIVTAGAVTVGAAEAAEMLDDPTSGLRPVLELVHRPGTAFGAYSSLAGGGVKPIQTTLLRDSRTRLIATGEVGGVMQESMITAITYLRSHGSELGIDVAALETSSVHIHLAGPTCRNDGASAGLAIVVSIASALLGRAPTGDVAFTGAIDACGDLVPVGNISQKAAAAAKAGVRLMVPHVQRRTTKATNVLGAMTVRDALYQVGLCPDGGSAGPRRKSPAGVAVASQAVPMRRRPRVDRATNVRGVPIRRAPTRPGPGTLTCLTVTGKAMDPSEATRSAQGTESLEGVDADASS
jgi:MoxR-like ATPase